MRNLSRLTLMIAAGAQVWAQTNAGCSNTTCSFSYTLTATGHGAGLPAYQASVATNTTLTATVGSVSTAIPLSFLGINGDGNYTTINLMIGARYVNLSLLQFTDSKATLNNLGRDGTANIYIATDDFTSATGSMSYHFACTSNTTQAGQCFNGVGTPVSDPFTFTFSGSGQITLPKSVATTILPTLFPPKPPPPGFVDKVVNYVETMWGPNQDPTNIPSQTTGPAPNARLMTTAGETSALGFVVPMQNTPATYTDAATCTNLTTGCWITMPQPTGSISAFGDTPITANVDFGTLGAGVYPANVSVSVTPTGQSTPSSTLNSSAQLVITNGAPALTLSESAIQFQSATGGNPLLHAVTLGSPGTLTYQATASTLSGGSWLSVTPDSGSIAPSANATVNITANPAGLAAGAYFGRVDINAPGASTAFQSIEVELAIGSAAAAPTFSPTGLIFITPQNKNPSSQDVIVSTPSTQPVALTAVAEPDDLGTWLRVSASETTFQSGQPIYETVSISTTGLAPGAYTGNVYESASTSSATAQYLVPVVLIVTPTQGTCTPTQLLPVLTNLYGSFEVTSGMPVPLAASVVDDCGNPLTTGWVQVTPSSDFPVALMSVGDGQWTGTWLSHGIAGGQASLVLAAQSQSGLQGSTSMIGTVDANPDATVVTPGGIVSAANPVAGAPLAPGEFISIYGSNLAPTSTSSMSFPYSTTLAGTQVLLGGVPLPLQFVSTGLINAVVPFETPINGTQELLIAQNGVYSLPETVVVAAAAPAVFTQDESGQGAGAIIVIPPDGNYFETSPSQPASAGDVLVIFCTGLGAVSPAVADGAAAPASSTTVNAVTATIGGQVAQVQFAGLAPGYAGLYQVNVLVPQGVSPGAAVPVVLTIGGFSSSPVTVSIQ